ncbi:MAG: head decoration protein [Mesorhizobium sp.]|uniref:head decoration protein n=1 Tax=Mesorhizobium sp. TaxID=1871066 RepID=UPI001222EF9F|nr:head decoration protein [Mesorhizobium sp.]TIN41386.1 MAG: head decoration protein [Mesorhizobium sp.]TJU86164.1 MAG: head decoration protein [Mesorhizobium sp.]
MPTLTMGPRDEEFILAEIEFISRSNKTLKLGEDLAAGTVLEDDGTGKLIACSGDLNTAGDALVTAVAGILCRTTDATDADTEVAVLDWGAAVKDDFIVYPTESTAGGEKAAVIASLLALGIKVR